LRVDQKPVESVIELNRELMNGSEARAVALQVQRDRERKTLACRMIPEKDVFNAALIRRKIGAALQELSPEGAAGMGLGSAGGFLITAVDSAGPAASADLRRGYVVQAIDGQRPDGMVEAARIFHRKKPGETVELDLIVPQQRGAFVRLFSARAEVPVRE
jgi:S1-C subfamily serine protease